MNIDKIYKPLKKKITTDGVHIVGIEIYDPEEVQELEEKYKELLIEVIYYANRFAQESVMRYGKYYRHDPYYDDSVDLKMIIERHTGLKWENIINENN